MEGRARVEALMLLIPTWGGTKVTEDNCIRGSGGGGGQQGRWGAKDLEWVLLNK